MDEDAVYRGKLVEKLKGEQFSIFLTPGGGEETVLFLTQAEI